MTGLTPVLGDTEVPLVFFYSETGTGGINGLTVLVAVRRIADGFYLDWADDTFKAAGHTTRQFTMLQPDATDSPGTYEKKWDSSLSVAVTKEYSAEYQVTTAGREDRRDELIEFKADLETDIATLQTDSTAILADTDEIQGKLPTDNIMGSAVLTSKDDEIDAIKAKTDNLPSDPASETNVNANETKIDALQVDSTAIKAVTDVIPDSGAMTSIAQGSDLAVVDAIVDDILVDTAEIGVAGANLTDLGGMSTGMKAEVNAEVDTALADINLDHLLKVASVDGDIINNSVIAKMVSKSATASFASFDNTTDSLEAISDEATLDAAQIAAAVWDALTSGFTVSGSFGELMAVVVGLSQKNYFLDSTIHNTQGLLTSGRIRIFPDNTFTATDGGSGEGETDTFNITTVAEAGTAGLVKTYQVKSV